MTADLRQGLRDIGRGAFAIPVVLFFAVSLCMITTERLVMEGTSTLWVDVKPAQSIRLDGIAIQMQNLEAARAASAKPDTSKSSEVSIAPSYVARVSTYGDRILWGVAAAVEVLAILSVLASCSIVLGRVYRDYGIPNPTTTGVATALAVILSIIIALFQVSRGDETAGIIRDFVWRSAEQDFSGLTAIWLTIDNVGFVAAVLMTVTVSIMMVVPPLENAGGRDQVLDRIQYLRVILYTGTALLVTSVLQFSFLLEWAETRVGTGDTVVAGHLHDAIMALVNYRAVFLSLILIALYTPAVFYLRSVGQDLIRNTLPPDATPAEIEKGMQENGYISSPKEMMPRLVAMLAPFLTGALSELVRHL